MRPILTLALALGLGFGSLPVVTSQAFAAGTQCRDTKGKFIACPAPKAAQCRGANGRFVKCGPDGKPS